MNDYLCIGIIIILFIYVFMNQSTKEGINVKKCKKKCIAGAGGKSCRKKCKKMKKKEKKKLASVLSGSKDSCDITGSTAYTYSDHIKVPSKLHMSGKGKSLNKNLSGISAYVDVLTKGKSKATKKKKTLGARYFDTTKGSTCYTSTEDSSNCTQQTAYPYVNDIPEGSSAGLIPSMLADLNLFDTTFSTNSTGSSGTACSEVVLAYATDACVGYGKSYMLNSDLNNLKDQTSLFYGGTAQTGIITDSSGNKIGNLMTDAGCGSESYMNMYEESKKPDRMIQLYTLLIGMGGIYFLHKLMYPTKTK